VVDNLAFIPQLFQQFLCGNQFRGYLQEAICKYVWIEPDCQVQSKVLYVDKFLITPKICRDLNIC